MWSRYTTYVSIIRYYTYLRVPYGTMHELQVLAMLDILFCERIYDQYQNKGHFYVSLFFFIFFIFFFVPFAIFLTCLLRHLTCSGTYLILRRTSDYAPKHLSTYLAIGMLSLASTIGFLL